MIRKRLGLWAPILVLAAALVMLAVSVDAVEAGGKGGGKPGGGSTAPSCVTCVLTVSPNPLPAHTQPTVSGTGFRPGVNYFVQVNGDIFSTTATADSSGSFSFVYTYRDLYIPGSYTMVAVTGGVKVAERTFTVVR